MQDALRLTEYLDSTLSPDLISPMSVASLCSESIVWRAVLCKAGAARQLATRAATDTVRMIAVRIFGSLLYELEWSHRSIR